MLYVLSERCSVNHVAWSTSYEFEEIIRHTCGAEVLSPRGFGVHPKLDIALGKVLAGRYHALRVEDVPRDSTLLVVAMGPRALRMLDTVENWRARFAKVAAYVVDLYPEALARLPQRIVRQLDYLFISYDQMFERVSQTAKVPVAVVHQAVDVLRQGAANGLRPIDVNGYGRQPRELVRALSERYNRPGSARIFLHSTQQFPRVTDWAQERQLFWQLLRRSRISLAFCFAVTHPERSHGVSPLTARWFEGMAAGCAMAGRRPASPEANRELDWEDAVIELPSDCGACADSLEALLRDEDRCNAISRRNYHHALRKHDWRHRLAEMLGYLKEPVPSRLAEELAELQGVAQGTASPP
jgi:hypothetical protein